MGQIITIKRGSFNPAKFLGEGWSVIEEETDKRSLALTELDLTKIELVTMLEGEESLITGEERLKRLNESGKIRLGVDAFLTFWENQHHIPESWKERVNGNIRFIFFDGTILRGPHGERCVLCLYWPVGRWYWDVVWLDRARGVCGPSVVLAN